MPQVNMWMDDEHYAALIKEAGKRMANTGKITKVSSLAYELLKPAIHNLNGNSPPIKDTNSDDKQVKEPKSDLADTFDQIDI